MQYFQRSLDLGREVGESGHVATVLHSLGWVALGQGDYGQAAILCEESLTLAREIRAKESMAYALRNLGYLAHRTGDTARALALYKECLPLFVELGKLPGLGECLIDLVEVLGITRQPRRAARLLGAADTFAASERIFRDPARRIRYEREMSAVRVQLGEKAFAAEWQAGQTMTPAQAIDAVFANWD